MKTLLIQLMVLLFALVAWVFYSRMDSLEDSLTEAKNWAENASQQLPASLPIELSGSNDSPTTNSESADNAQTVYKWQDADGRWHFGDSAPANAAKLESRKYSIKTPPARPQAEAPPLESASPEISSQRSSTTASNPQQQPSVGSLLPTPGNVSRLMEQAQQAADAMSQRTQTLETLTGGAGAASSGSDNSNQTSTNPYRLINGR